MRVDEASYFGDELRMKTLIPSAGCVADAHVAANAAIATTKTRHKHRKTISQSGTAVAATLGLHVVQGLVGSVVSFKAGTITLCTGNATITVDLKKNGASILAAVITLDTANVARVLEAGNVSTPALAVGDWLEIVVAVNAGSGGLGTGLVVQIEIDEDAV